MVKAEIKDEVYQEFYERLVRATEIYQTGTAGPDELVAAIVALSATTNLIREMPGIDEHHLHLPLVNLNHSLQDYAADSNPDIFKRGLIRRRPPDTTKRKVLRADAAMDMLMLSGFGRQKAAEFVAEKLTKDGWQDMKKGVPSPITWRKVAGWRDRANEGDKTKLDQDLYRHYKKVILPQLNLRQDGQAEGRKQAIGVLDKLSIRQVPDNRSTSAIPKF